MQYFFSREVGKCPHLHSSNTQPITYGQKATDGPESSDLPASSLDSCARGRNRPQGIPNICLRLVQLRVLSKPLQVTLRKSGEVSRTGVTAPVCGRSEELTFVQTTSVSCHLCVVESRRHNSSKLRPHPLHPPPRVHVGAQSICRRLGYLPSAAGKSAPGAEGWRVPCHRPRGAVAGRTADQGSALEPRSRSRSRT